MLKTDVCFDITKYFKKCKADKAEIDRICWIDRNFEPHEGIISFYQVEDIKCETLFISIKLRMP